MSHRERMLTAIDLKEPDIVPITDLGPDPSIIEKITGEEWKGLTSIRVLSGKKVWKNIEKNVLNSIKACKKLDFDAVNITDYVLASRDYVPKFIDIATFVDEWGRILKT